MLMTVRRPHVIFAAVVAIALGATLTRTRAVQEWYETVHADGKIAAYLLDDRAAVTGLLLDGGQQIRTGPRLGEAIASRVKKGDVVSVVGRGGRATSFGQYIDAHAVTINGQTVTFAGESEGPRGEPRHPGRGGLATTPAGARDGRGGRPAPAGRESMPGAPPRPESDARFGPDPRDAPLPPERGDQAGPPEPRPASARPQTVHGTLNTFLVGPRGEVRGLILATGEQVRFPPRVGETVAAQTGALHPEVTVLGEVVRSEYGIIVRAAQLTVGSNTLIVR
jgi:hypothetical protein